jgi:hypothetical protein
LGEEILEFFTAPTVKHTSLSWRRRLQPFNLERKVWVIEKLWKHIWIHASNNTSQTDIFPHGTKSLLISVVIVKQQHVI